MHWIAYSILANVFIAFIEYINHAAGKPNFGSALLITGIPILICQYALYRAFSGANSMFMAWMVFTVGNSLCCVISVKLFVHQPISHYQLLGISVIILGGYLIKMGS